ncbi:CHAT domain-containing tetratricopeptide repeat protein [Sphingomonas silueang]|uniref:CHAT domain-containing tetratricopeptide repeat protein n=1 Tax=Sphingomonas silueang TaxID=3156617 RepID=UPI0032B49EE3
MRRQLIWTHRAARSALPALSVLLTVPSAARPEAPSVRRAPSAALKAAIDAERTAEGATLAEREVAACLARPRFADDCLDLLEESVSLQIDAGRPQLAVIHARSALAIARARFGEDAAETGNAYGNLGSALQAAGRLVEALAPKQRDLAIARHLLGEAHGDTAISYNNVGVLLDRLGRHEEGESMLRRAIVIWRALPDERRNLGIAHHGLARNLDQQGRLAEGMAEYDAALAVYATILPPNHPQIANLLTSIAISLRAQDRLPEAEAAARRALAMREARLPPGHPDIGSALKALANILGDAGREHEAEALTARALTIERQALGMRHPDVAFTLANLAVGTLRQGRAGDAAALLREAIAILDAATGTPHPKRVGMLLRLADALRTDGDAVGAEAVLRDALAQATARSMPDPADPARARVALASLLADTGRAAEALPLIEAALPLLPGGPAGTTAETIVARSLHGAVLHRLRRIADARVAIDGAAAAAITRFERYGTRSVEQRRALRDVRTVFERQVAITWDAVRGARVRGCDADCGAAFVAAQWAIYSGAGQAIDGAALRRGDNPLAVALRERDALVLARDATDRRYLKVAALDTAQAAILAGRIAEQDAALTALDARIVAAQRGGADLLRPRPVSIATVQALLAPGEVLVMAVPGETAGHVWAIRRDRVRWVRRTGLSHARLATRVARLRAGLGGAGAGMRGQMGRISGARFDLADAAALGEDWFGSARDQMGYRSRVISVASGALASVPPAALRIGGRWLIDRTVVTALPSPANLLRSRCQACTPVRPDGAIAFVGMGAPAPNPAMPDLPPLPHARDELAAIATHFPGRARWWTGSEATEARLRGEAGLPVARYITLATHAVRTGDGGPAGEPALLLTPGNAGDPADDGLLTASEAATLRIGADLVVLSACDTAAADGAFTGEDLSGLARGFFAAGARGVLVSHWPIDDAATALVSPALFAGIGSDPAAALRDAMRRLRDTPGRRWAHPRYWAAFTLVGDIAARR